MSFELTTTPFGSDLYSRAVELRRRILRIPLGLDFTEEQLAAESSDVHLVANEDGEVVGVLVLTQVDPRTVQMRQVAVSPSLQRSGVGTLLVHRSEEIARDSGYERMILHAREEAVPFYERLGYVVEGEPFIEVTIPHRTMAKSL